MMQGLRQHHSQISEERVTLTPSSGDLPYAVLSLKKRVYYVSLQSALLKGYKVRVTELSAATGESIGQPILLNSDGELTSKDSILHIGTNSGIPFLVWTDKTFKTIRVNIIGTKQITQLKTPISDGKLEKITVHAPKSHAAKAHLLVHYQEADSHSAEIFHLTSGSIEKPYDLPRRQGQGAFAASSQGSEVYFTRHTTSEYELISSEDARTLNQWKAQSKDQVGLIDAQEMTYAVSEVVLRGPSTYAVRSALSLLSGDWRLIRNGEFSWSRPEGLAGVIAAAFVGISKEEDLAKELAAEGQSYPLTAYIHRIKRHVRDLRRFPAWAELLPRRLLSSLMGDGANSQAQNLQPDSFGFRKLIIVATENGRLAALDAANQGIVLWNIQAVVLKSDQLWVVLGIEAEDGAALVRGRAGELLRVSLRTGTILKHQPGATESSLKASFPVADRSGNKIFIPVKTDGSLGSIPNADFDESTVVVTQAKDNAVIGWSLSKSSKPVLLWRFTPADGEHVISISPRPSHDPVASIGKALGDRNVLYKYLNPNMLLITASAIETSTASFYALDSASGVVVYSVSHPGVDVSKPIAATMSENWFAYSLFSESNAATQGTSQTDREKVKSYQLIVSEFYESPYPNNRGSLGSSSNSSSIFPPADFTGDSVDTPHVISQTFLIPGPISSMAVTSTLQGITTRSLLCVLPELNAVISISRAFLDPRRPVGRDATAAEAEEGLFRYSPTLDFEPKWMLSHRRDILTISHIITTPSLLESTSLIFAFGEIDLFGTRTAPIGAFDLLGKGFSKLQLMLTVLALAVGTTIVAPFVS